MSDSETDSTISSHDSDDVPGLGDDDNDDEQHYDDLQKFVLERDLQKLREGYFKSVTIKDSNVINTVLKMMKIGFEEEDVEIVNHAMELLPNYDYDVDKKSRKSILKDICSRIQQMLAQNIDNVLNTCNKSAKEELDWIDEYIILIMELDDIRSFETLFPLWKKTRSTSEEEIYVDDYDNTIRYPLSPAGRLYSDFMEDDDDDDDDDDYHVRRKKKQKESEVLKKLWYELPRLERMLFEEMKRRKMGDTSNLESSMKTMIVI